MPEQQFFEIQYPSSRQFTMDIGKIGREKHHVKALLEVDVTAARRKIRELRRQREKISFTAWVLKVIAGCVSLHPPINGINSPRRNKVVVFRDIDMSIVVEKEVNGSHVPLPYVLRKVNEKTLHQIYSEIEAVRSQSIENESDYVLGEKYNRWLMKFFVGLPQRLRLGLMWKIVLSNPEKMNAMMGSVMITTVGMVGHTRGWIMPYSIHPLCIALGSMSRQPVVCQGEIQKREVLRLTVLIDHDVIDGMPAAHFVDDLAKKMEAGWEL
jgi:pyruvate/2-oxoglutarate dehydrogenase complex dihydrolipoamide acyltransferase (E2) component